MSFADAELIARVLSSQDKNAFGELVRRYQSPVRGFLAKMARGDSHLADDLAQETFVKAWRKLGSYRGKASFSAWLFSIAMNEFRSASRKRKELLSEDVLEMPPEAEMSYERPSLKLDLAEALSRLSFEERAAVVLCCQNGLSHEEASKALECPLGTVKTHILRGKEKLRQCLSSYLHESH